MEFCIWMIFGFIVAISTTFLYKEDWHDVDNLWRLIFSLFFLSVLWPVVFFIMLLDFLTKKRKFWLHKK